jgi:8-oxo-dGTP pyrophosphatase MutT (NUDIX family)
MVPRVGPLIMMAGILALYDLEEEGKIGPLPPVDDSEDEDDLDQPPADELAEYRRRHRPG